MSTVLVVEDQFMAGYDLECALNDRGYDTRLVATPGDALAQYRALRKSGDLVAVVCDNRLIDDRPAASDLYRAIRASDGETPFIVYSGFPPDDLPANDPRLAIVRKPFVDRVLAHVVGAAPARGKAMEFDAQVTRREAA